MDGNSDLNRRGRGALTAVLALLAALFAATGAATVPAAAQSVAGAYTDDEGSVHEWAIDALTGHGIASGCTPTTFCPTTPIDRATMAVWLIRALGEEDSLHGHVGYFTDVPASHPDAAYIERLFELGVTEGVGGGRYAPDGSVSRAQMAAYLVRAFGGSGTSPSGGSRFADVPASAWFWADAEALYDLGITIGCSTSPLSYCPAQMVPRSQMATFVARAVGIDPPMPVVGEVDSWDPPDCPGGGFCLTPTMTEGFGMRNLAYCVKQESTRLFFDEWAFAADAFAAYENITVGGVPMFDFTATTDCRAAQIEINWSWTLDPKYNGVAYTDDYFEPTYVRIEIRDDGTLTAALERSVLIHEIGHALGLGHSLQPACIMYPDSGGTGMQNGTFCQEELDAIGALYTGYTGSAADTFHNVHVIAEGEFGPTEVVAALVDDGNNLPLPCAVDDYWMTDADMGWACRWGNDGSNWTWEVERIDNDFDGLGLGVGLTAVTIDTQAYAVTWEQAETVIGNGTRDVSFLTTDRGLVVPFVTVYDPDGDNDYGFWISVERQLLDTGPWATYDFGIHTGNGDVLSAVVVQFVRIEPTANWFWSYGFTSTWGVDGQTEVSTKNKVGADKWTDTTHFSVTTANWPNGVEHFLWDTHHDATSSECPGTADRCVETTLLEHGGNSGSLAEVMTVVLGR